MLRVINEARPSWVLGENVPGIIPMELDNVLSDLESIGYAARPFVIPACAIDARHRRDRLWIIGRYMGNSDCDGWQERKQTVAPVGHGEAVVSTGNKSAMANSNRDERHGRSSNVQMGWLGRASETPQDNNAAGIEWLTEPDVGRVANGIPHRVDRLKGLGNAIVPQVAYEILREIRKLIP